LRRASLSVEDALKIADDDQRPSDAAPRKVGDLTMGELHWILSEPNNWTGIGIRFDRAIFCREFDAVREIRNDIMHFRDLPDTTQARRIQDFANVVRQAYDAQTTASD
jgi:hypothetical protein